MRKRSGQGRAVAAAILLFLAGSATAEPRWQSFLYGGEVLCAEGRGSEFWVGTPAGVRILDGAGPVVRTRELTTRDGLPGPLVTALAFQPDKVWAGTAAGVIGQLDLVTNQWHVFDERARVPNAPISALLWDGTDVWAATLGGGVARYNVLRHDFEVWDTKEGLPSANVTCLAVDPGGLWAGTDRGLLRYVKNLLSWEPLHVPAGRLDGRIDSLAVGGDCLWVASAGDGLSRVQLKTGELLTYDLAKYGVQRVDRVLSGPLKDIWVATDNGLLHAADAGEGAWEHLPHEPWLVRGMALAGDSLWVGTDRQGSWRYRLDTGMWEQYQPREVIPSGTVRAAATQASLAWFGFEDDAVARYDLLGERWETLAPPGGAPRQVRDLAVYGNFVYCACRDGIAVYDQRNRSWRTFTQRFEPDLQGDEWTSVIVAAGQVWFAGPGRVSVFSTAMDLLSTVPLRGSEGDREGTLPKLAWDESTGDVWCLTRTLAYRYQPRQQLWSWLDSDLFMPRDEALYRQEGYLIRSAACDNDSVWFVTLDRICQYRKQLNDLVPWDAGYDAALREPQALSLDRYSVWAATAGGLCRFSRQDARWDVFPWDEALAGATATALAVDAEEPTFVWVATDRRVARLDLAEGHQRWTVFPANTGMVAGVHTIVPGADAVWFVGRGGVTVYRRERAAVRAP
ncbi:MAG: hypothetical protein HYU66_23885 [Armatimonadetes bacterium]|nr:hypothetical protein [Armatimonadota bacterium]